MAREVGSESYRAFAAKARIAAGAVRLRLAQMRIELPHAGVNARSAFEPRTDGHLCVDCWLAVAGAAQCGSKRFGCCNWRWVTFACWITPPKCMPAIRPRRVYAVPDRVRAKLVLKLAASFPCGDDELDRELARLLGMLTAYPDTLRAAMAAKWTDDSPVEDDLHYLIVASLLAGERQPEFTTATADALLRLHGKLSAAGEFTSRNWPFRVKEFFEQLVRRDPALPQAIAESALLGHPGHAMFVEELPTMLRPAAVRKLWSAVLAAGQEPSPEMVALAGELPAAEAAALLRLQWEHGALRDAVILELAKGPQPVDRAKLVEALSSPQPEVVEQRGLRFAGARRAPHH